VSRSRGRAATGGLTTRGSPAPRPGSASQDRHGLAGALRFLDDEDAPLWPLGVLLGLAVLLWWFDRHGLRTAGTAARASTPSTFLRRLIAVEQGAGGLVGGAELGGSRLDLRYVENWSMALDLTILWKTIGAVLKGRGAY
jgi:hypothetical protein